MPAAVRLDFDPSTTVLGTSVRFDMLALAGVVFVVLVIAALQAGRAVAPAGIDGAGDARRLRRDDLILFAFGAVPGAVIGGRLGYGLLHLDYYRTDPSALFDPGRGGMELTLAVLLGALTAISVARLLAAPIGRWLAVVAVPLLFGLSLGKLTMVLGGTGQGVYSDASYATLYVRPGQWGSANPDFAAIPSQALEGGLVLGVLIVVLIVPFLLRLRFRAWSRVVRPALAPRRDWALLTGGRRFLTALGLWAAARFVVVFTWRDAHVLGPLAAEQLILIGVMVLALGGPLVIPGWQRAGVVIPAWRATRAERRAQAETARVEAAGAETAKAETAAKLEADATSTETAKTQARPGRRTRRTAASGTRAVGQAAYEAESTESAGSVEGVKVAPADPGPVETTA